MLISCTYNSNSRRWDCKSAGGVFAIETYNRNLGRESNSETAEAMVLNHQKINHFPRGFGLIFPHLKRLHIISCGLTTISRDDLIGLEELEHLDGNSNHLTSLPSDLFIGKTKLKSISFKDNKLETMSSKLLEPILKNEPTLIDFRGNTKIDAVYKSAMPKGISLEQLMELIAAKCNKPANKQVHALAVKCFEKDFTAGLADIWKSGEHSDLTVIANDQKEFRVHKTVLAIQSSVFAAMFKSNIEETRTGKMAISDFSAQAVEQFLACLYTGKIKDGSYAIEVFALAAKYDVPKLKMACEQNILESIDNFNAY